MGPLNSLEHAVMKKLLDRNSEPFVALKNQYQALKVKSRKLTGVGFFTYFSMSDDVPPLPDASSFHIGDVGAYLNDHALEVGFVLFIREGRIRELEGYTYEEPWPKEVTSFELFYDGTSDRK